MSTYTVSIAQGRLALVLCAITVNLFPVLSNSAQNDYGRSSVRSCNTDKDKQLRLSKELMCAVGREIVKLGEVKKLLAEGADPNYMDEGGYTPFMKASNGFVPRKVSRLHHEKIGLMILLLDAGADINVKDPQGFGSLFYAASYDDEDCVEMLVARGAHVPTDKELMALTNREKKMIKESVGLISTVQRKAFERAKRMLERGEDPNQVDKRGQTPLHWAARHKNLELMWLLLDKGARHSEVDKFGNTPLMEAATGGHVKGVRLLLERGANPNQAIESSGWTPLMGAALMNNADTVQLLLDRHAEVNAESSNGTALAQTNSLGLPEMRSTKRRIIELLLAAGANTNVKDRHGRTPLVCAAMRSEEDLVEMLLAHDAHLPTSEELRQLPTDVQKSIQRYLKDFVEKKAPRLLVHSPRNRKKQKNIMTEEHEGTMVQEQQHNAPRSPFLSWLLS